MIEALTFNSNLPIILLTNKNKKDNKMTNHSTKSLVYIAIGTALIAALSQISLSIGPVPFTLQTLAIGLIACLYKPKEALASVALYLALGAIGLPIFAGFSGGFAALVGPNAGFLWGFLIYAMFIKPYKIRFLTVNRFSRLPTRNRDLLPYRFLGL